MVEYHDGLFIIYVTTAVLLQDPQQSFVRQIHLAENQSDSQLEQFQALCHCLDPTPILASVWI